MKLTLVVASHKRQKSLRRLLSSLEPTGNQYEIILVGNTTEDDNYVYSEARRASNLKVSAVISGGIGVNRARNLGAKLATGEIVFFVDDDCYFNSEQRSSIQKITQIFDSDPDLQILGGSYTLPRSRMSAPALAYHIISQNWFLQGQLLSAHNWRLFGGCLAVRKSLFAGGLLYDESITFGGAESEFLLRCLSLGHKSLGTEEVSITHCCELDVEGLIEKAKAQSRTAERFQRFSLPQHQVPSCFDYKDALISRYTRSALNRLRVARNIAIYEANFSV